jgi:hypothetical protein
MEYISQLILYSKACGSYRDLLDRGLLLTMKLLNLGFLVVTFFRKWPFSGEDDRGKTSPRALVFTRCDIQSERL